jgi:hypothetical protein
MRFCWQLSQCSAAAGWPAPVPIVGFGTSSRYPVKGAQKPVTLGRTVWRLRSHAAGEAVGVAAESFDVDPGACRGIRLCKVRGIYEDASFRMITTCILKRDLVLEFPYF